MLEFDAARWAVLSPLFDEALALPSTQRWAWLEALRQHDAQAAGELEPLLNAQAAAAQAGFLEAQGGEHIGAYKLLRVLGEGGMGRVWLAERADGRFDGQFAIKLLQAAANRPGFAERFRREGSILARLSHPNIARLVDAGLTAQGEAYLVLEYVDGQRIDHGCDERALPVRDRVRLFLQVLQATAHAHANLVIHRDLKPANVLLARNGQDVKLLDFGIARLIDTAQATTGPEQGDLTAENGALFTPRYAAPERWLGTAPTTASDIWSLGTCLFELLTGQHPMSQRAAGSTPSSIAALAPPQASRAVQDSSRAEPAELERLARLRASTPSAMARSLSGDLDAILARATAIDPSHRYATAAAMMDDLSRYLRGDMVAARPAKWSYRAHSLVRQHRAVVAAAAAGLVAIIGLASTAVWQWHQAQQARDIAIERLRVAEAVRAFSAELLGISGPGGRSLNIEESVDHAEAMARHMYAQDPEVMAELLLIIGAKNALLQRVPARVRALNDAQSAASRGRNDALKAHAECSAVPMEADDAAARVRAIAQSLPQQAPFARARYRCHSYLATLLAWDGQPALAQLHAQASEDALQDTGPLERALRAEVLETRADVARASGDFVRADTHYMAALEALNASGRGDTLNAASLLNYRVVMQTALGRPREGLALAIAVKKLLTGMSAAESMPAYMHTNEGQMLFELGRWDEAEAALRLAIQRGMSTDTPQYLANARGRLAALLLRQGRVGEAEPLVASYVEFARTRPSAAGAALVHTARLALAQGHPAQALKDADAALRTIGNNSFQRSSLIGTWLLRSQAQLALGRPQDAAASAERALAVVRAFVPPGQRSVHLARAHLAHALALALAEQPDAARQAAQRAADEFAATVDARHPDALEALKLAGR